MTIYIIFVVMLYVEGLFSALFGSRLCNESIAVGCVLGCFAATFFGRRRLLRFCSY